MFIFNNIANFRENLSHCHSNIDILINGLKSLTVSRSLLSHLRSMELSGVSIDAIVAVAKQKQTKMVFKIEDLVLIKVLCQEKG